MGLYNYPILMAVDILIMETDLVPVGRDQAQHVEYAADIAGSFNHLFGDGYTLPHPPRQSSPKGTRACCPASTGAR